MQKPKKKTKKEFQYIGDNDDSLGLSCFYDGKAPGYSRKLEKEIKASVFKAKKTLLNNSIKT